MPPSSDDLINQFVLFLPKVYQYEASMLINQMNQQRQTYPAYEEPYIPPYQQPVYETVQPEYVSTRRKTRATRATRTAPPPPAPSSPVVGPAPKTRRRAYAEEEGEVESEALPASDRRFFDRVGV